MTTTTPQLTNQERLNNLIERIESQRNRLDELNNGERHGEETLTGFSIGWDSCLRFLAEQHNLDLTTL
jgi:hypothetical protein